MFAIYYLVRHYYLSRQAKSRPLPLAVKTLIRMVYFPLILISLMGPSFGGAIEEVKSVGKDIFLLIDISKSMDAHDIAPSRIEKVKFEIKKIIEAFTSDYLGIISFSSEAFMQCPLTFDDNMLFIVMEALNTGQISSGGTDFAPALEMALHKLNIQQKNTSQKSRSKVVILISDGEDFGEETIQAAKKLKEEQVRLFTMGVGTANGSRIPTGNGFKTRNGELIVSKLNAKSLADIAKIAGGTYYEISDRKDDIQKLIQEIGDIEGELRSIKEVDASANKYHYFLAVAFILMLADFIWIAKVIRI